MPSVHQLYGDHHGWLRGWLRHRLGCPHDADDLAQDTFVRVIRHAGETALHEPRSYLLTIARGLTVDLFRRRTLERQYLQALAAMPVAHWPSEEDRAQAMQALLEIDAMLDGLGHKIKQVLLLSQFEGLTYAEIAQTLGLSLRTVNTYMTRAVAHCCLFRLQSAG